MATIHKGIDTYQYKGKLYVYLDEVQVKNQTTRQWEVGVLYADQDGNRYVREIGEFFERFSEVKYWERDKLKRVYMNYKNKF